MLMMLQTSAKVRGAKTPAPQVPTRQMQQPVAPAAPVKTAPVISAGTFQDFMHQIKNMNPDTVINDQGIFSDTFKNFVKRSGLAPELMKTLLQAGRNLHLPLRGSSTQDIRLIVYTEKNITDFIANLQGANQPAPLMDVPQTNPIVGKPLVPQAPVANAALVNTSESPLAYANRTYKQFANLLRPYFVPSDNRNKKIGAFKDHNKRFADVLDTLLDHILSAYPEISLKDLREAVIKIVLNNNPYQGLKDANVLMQNIANYISPDPKTQANVAQINRPATKTQTLQLPAIDPKDKPHNPIDYAALITEQFDAQLQIYFYPSGDNVFVFGANTKKFEEFIINMMSLMLKEYPQITLEDLIESVKGIVLLNKSFPSRVSNRKVMENYIKHIITREQNPLQAQSIPQPQLEPQDSPQNYISSTQLTNIVVQNLTKIDKQKPIEYLFQKDSASGSWYIKMPSNNDEHKYHVIYRDATTLIENLTRILRDTYPNKTSQNAVRRAIEEGLKLFLLQKYNKKFEDIDIIIDDYLSSGGFKRVMSEKTRTN